MTSTLSHTQPPAKVAVPSYSLVQQDGDHELHLDAFLDQTIGADRHKRPSYSYRNSVPALGELSLAAVCPDGRLLGSLRFWPVELAGGRALLLGPLAVDPTLQGGGIGRALMEQGLHHAQKLGYELCFLVGEPSYYARFGFEAAVPKGYDMIVEVDARKFQVMDLQKKGWEKLPVGTIYPVRD
ncbi:GNAT family N-acetyltransferase [Kiloniella sp. b19]|uniref:GNAT family N-acetyltransferase n=1 Tax=Kiloniella sp. GXU_MW_B19 TaxID=3141326 RepID=UPI0031DBEB3B